MGDSGDYWREAKEYKRRQKARYEKSIRDVLQFLYEHKDCVEVGDHHRIGGVWDFWYTGTVRNIITGEDLSIHELAKRFSI